MNKLTQSFKAQVSNKAKELGLQPQILLQNYLLEQFLMRVSKSKYKNTFILKGGFLISTFIGINNRTTMDIDASISGIDFTETEIKKYFNEIANVPIDDNVDYAIDTVKSIREGSEYGGIRLTVVAKFFNIRQFLKFDFSTGDVITPRHIMYKYRTVLGGKSFNIQTYNLETILAEKIQTIFSKEVANTRMRDFYDLYIISLLKKNDINFKDLNSAIIKTLKSRNTPNILNQWESKLKMFEKNENLNKLWSSFIAKNSYVNNLEFADVILNIKNELISKTKLQ